MDTRQKKLYWLAAGLLLAVTVVAYWPSFSVPFYLDDFAHLSATDRLHDATDVATIWNSYKTRFVPSWTLAVNYQLHGEDVFGYHLVNFSVHLLAGFAVWVLLSALLRSTNVHLENNPHLIWIPLLATGIFLLHPLQTQAVTYIIQRHASMAGMFYLLSLAAFAWGRVRGDWRLLSLAALGGALALLSKQSAATLPLAVLLIELLFFRRLRPKSVALVAASTVIMAAVATWLLHLPIFDIQGLTKETNEISRLDYLATQLAVLWRYIGLFFLIGEQRLEYGLPLIPMGLRGEVMIPALGHLALLSISLLTWRRNPLIAFGILFYYLTHLVESTIIPIRDIAFEHRTYLPNIGLSAALVGALFLALKCTRKNLNKVIAISLMVVAVAGIYQTLQRNILWSNPIKFMKAEVRLTPHSYRAWGNLAMEYFREDLFSLSMHAFNEAYSLAEKTPNSKHDDNLLVYHLITVHKEGLHQQVIEKGEKIDADRLLSKERFWFHFYLGRSLLITWSNKRDSQNLLLQANRHLNIAANIDNKSAESITLLAASEMYLGDTERARSLALFVLNTLDPGHSIALQVLQQTGGE